MQKLTIDDLEKVNGGIIFNSKNIIGANKDKPWEVLNNENGDVIEAFATKDEALKKASSLGGSPLNTLEVNWDQVCHLRKK